MVQNIKFWSGNRAGGSFLNPGKGSKQYCIEHNLPPDLPTSRWLLKPLWVCYETFKSACKKGHSELVEAATLELPYI